jgi:anti-sigma-K factor RskA
MTMDEDRDGFAAEFVLGTLDAEERAQADSLMLTDPAFAAAVRQWERRLGELNVLVAPVEPPAPVWDRIKLSLADASPGEPIRLPDLPAQSAPAPEPAGPSAEVIDLTQRMRRWRGLTVITSALAASIVGIVVTREYRPAMLPPDWRPKQQVVERVVEKILEKPVEVVREVVREVPSARPAQFVAVFQKDEQSPAFLMSVDIDKRTVTVRQVAAERLADKSYQLWIATQPGSAPQSLGVIEQQDAFTIRATLAAYDPTVINNATFGISLEPLGGSPTGQPTGPVIHAKLLQVTPPQNP